MKKLLLFSVLTLLLILNVAGYSQPQPPTLIAPPNNSTAIPLFPTFDWTDVSGATSYQLQIFQGANTILDQNGISVSQFTMTSALLEYNTEYYWRVRASGPGGTSQWSAQWFFTTQVQPPAVPILLSPANGAVDVSLTPTLDWENAAYANYYRLQVSTSNTFTSTVIDVTGLTNSAYVVTSGSLQYGTIYYWRVNSNNNGGTSNWSAIWSFTTLPAPPIAPTLIAPLNGSINVSTSPTIDWSDVPNAVSYRLQVAFNSSFTSLAIDQSGITSSQFIVQPGVLSGTTQYYWRVLATNNGGDGPWSTVWNFTTIIGAPAAPLLVSPVNSSTNVTLTPLLDWNNVPNAISYRVQVSTDQNFTTTVVNQVVTTSQFQVPINLQTNTLYYWRANATNNGGTGPWSSVWNFTTRPAPPSAPVLVSPPNLATNIPLTPELVWNAAANATSYRVQVSTSASFTSLVVNIAGITATSYSIPSGYLIGNTQYYWRVSAANSGGEGSFSSYFRFTTIQSFNLNLKVYLEGFYNNGLQVKDTVKIYLANSTSPFTLRDSSGAFLDSMGNALMSFSLAPNGSYYIIVKHRNHLETWTSGPIPFSTGSTAIYDFTTNATKAYGSNMKQIGSVYVLYGGDANHDGFVNPTDYNVFKSQFGLDNYQNADFNGDGFVDGKDTPFIYTNFGKSYARPF